MLRQAFCGQRDSAGNHRAEQYNGTNGFGYNIFCGAHTDRAYRQNRSNIAENGYIDCTHGDYGERDNILCAYNDVDSAADGIHRSENHCILRIADHRFRDCADAGILVRACRKY